MRFARFDVRGDPVIVFDEVLSFQSWALETRRPEVEHIAPTIERYRKILLFPHRPRSTAAMFSGLAAKFCGTLRRTNSQAILNSNRCLEPFGYLVKARGSAWLSH